MVAGGVARPVVVDWTHRAKGAALLAAVAAVVGLLVAENPPAILWSLFVLVAFGVAAMLVGLAWLFLTAARED